MTRLSKFRLASFRILLTALTPIAMPPYAGSTLRGGFGRVFRKLVCTMGPIACGGCSLNTVCPYAYLFETAPFEGATQLRTYADVPRPFILDPLETSGRYEPGERLEFALTLIGRAIDYLPYFIVSFRELGEMGIGRGHGRFQLAQVVSADGSVVYSAETQLVKNAYRTVSFEDVQQQTAALPRDRLTLHFLTPTRLTYEGNLTEKLPFHVLWRRLIGRISALAYFHCRESLEMDFKGLIERAMAVKTVESRLRWHDWTRYSFRQEKRMKLGGVVDRVTYAGDLTPFLPFVALGQYLHVGKNATFGLGKYWIESIPN